MSGQGTHSGGVKVALALVVGMLLVALLGGCGGGAQSAGKTNDFPPAPVETRVDADHDEDIGAPFDDTNHRSEFDLYRPASPADRRAIVALVKSYYAAALAEDGARGCSLLYSTLAESTVEDDSREPDSPPYMRGQSTCAGVLHALFHHYHLQLAYELPKRSIWRVRVEGLYGYVFMRFGALPERQTGVEREGRVWKMSRLYDVGLP